mmetsp:Transcript_39764/g.61134  ORF Transcript_39764/g.61134 Transcript_39764/m.61134 type:complete len:124 (+) Transcript_39764:3-374(+)
MDTKYVSYMQLLREMQPESGLLWSPWFRIIALQFLGLWWEDLPKALTTDEFFDPKTIHRFDCSEEHMGGAGGAGPWLNMKGSEFGDQWLGQVAVNKGKAPKVPELKSLLQKDEEGKYRLEADE